MGHIAHLRNQLTSMKTFKQSCDYIYHEIGPVVLKKVFKFCQCILAFLNYLPLEKGRIFHLNKLECPSPENSLCQVWLKMAHWFFLKNLKFLKFVNLFLLLLNYLPLEKGGGGFHLAKIDFFHQGIFFPKFV